MTTHISPLPIQRADGQTYVGANIQTDGFLMYNNCTFRHCTLMFNGGTSMIQPNCTFENCRWAFGGPAVNTLIHLKSLYAKGGLDRQAVEMFIREIRGEAHSEPKKKEATLPFDPTKKTVQ